MSEAPQHTIAEISELAGGLAHELRNPLSTMMLNLELLAEGLRETEAHPDDIRRRALLKVDVLRREAERLQSLFDKFLHLTGPHRLERADIDLNVVVHRLVEFFEPSATSRHIDVQVVGTDDPLVCCVDEKLLRQGLLNLVINAQAAMPGGGLLRITLRSDGRHALIDVSDNGVGVADADRERIFRPFFSTKSGGSGLGLSITQRIVAEHGGTLRFTSSPGKGTTFTVSLPLEAQQAGPDRPAC